MPLSQNRITLSTKALAILAGGLSFAAAALFWHINRRRFYRCLKEKEKDDEQRAMETRAMLDEAEFACEQGNHYQRVIGFEEFGCSMEEVNGRRGRSWENVENDRGDYCPAEAGNEQHKINRKKFEKEVSSSSENCLAEQDAPCIVDTARFEWCDTNFQQLVSINGEDKVVDKRCGDNANANMGYNAVGSPSGHSEESQDSGRATGGLASSMSPAEDVQETSVLVSAVYEFEVPHGLVGLIIGIKGKTVKELSLRANVRMTIRPHHSPTLAITHQVCTVEGPRDNINKCLRMLRRRFPSDRFPDLNLKPVIPPHYQIPFSEILEYKPIQMELPEGVRCPVSMSCIINPGNFFLVLSNTPCFDALRSLDAYMAQIYGLLSTAPPIEKPIEQYFCVAPAFGGWFRVIIVHYFDESDEVLVKFVDYGGTAQLARADLRQIRSDFMSFPFQAIQCCLAHIEPNNDDGIWSVESLDRFHSLTSNLFVEAFVAGYTIDENMPVVELFATNAKNTITRIDKVLLEEGLARVSDPSKIRPVLPMPSNAAVAFNAPSFELQQQPTQNVVAVALQ